MSNDLLIQTTFRIPKSLLARLRSHRKTSRVIQEKFVSDAIVSALNRAHAPAAPQAPAEPTERIVATDGPVASS